jgi:hypothetical protein
MVHTYMRRNYPARPAPPVGKMSRVLEGRFSSIDPTVSRLTRTGTAFKSGRYLIPQSGRSPLAPTGSNPVRRARLRVKPRPALANVYQSPTGCKLEIKLAGIGQRWLEVERAMGIEPTAQAWEAWVLPLYDARASWILCASPRSAQILRPGRRPAPHHSKTHRAGGCRAGEAGIDQLASATAEGLTPVVTVGVLSTVSDPSAAMANCDTVLSLMFVAYAY